MDLTVTIRESDEDTLKELAESQWRDLSQQASALLEEALRQRRAQRSRVIEGAIKRRGRPAAAA